MIKKKVLLLLSMICICFQLTGCAENSSDAIEVYNKKTHVLDNITIEVKEGYFYDKHEKFTVDDNTIGITVYFSKEEVWDNK